MRRPALIASAAVVAGVICWRFPLFHIVSLSASRATASAAAFNAEKYADEFWRTRLAPRLGKGADARAVVEGLRRDPAATAKQHGRSLGLSDATLYLISGSGTVRSIDDQGVSISLQAGEGEPDFLLRTGLLFGNTVRDASGLLDVNAFANSQDFNALSAELNKIVESRVAPALKAAAAVGRRVRFTAALEVEAGAERDRPLAAVPLEAVAE